MKCEKKPVGEKERCVVIYDGNCGFCQKQIARIRRWDRNSVFEFVPSQETRLIERFPQLAEEDFNTGLRLIDPSGRVHVGADGTYQIARRLPFWRHIVWLYRVPGLTTICRAAYRWIAANRQSLGGTCVGNQCSQPSPHEITTKPTNRGV